MKWCLLITVRGLYFPAVIFAPTIELYSTVKAGLLFIDIPLTKTTASQNEAAPIYHRVRRVIFSVSCSCCYYSIHQSGSCGDGQA